MAKRYDTEDRIELAKVIVKKVISSLLSKTLPFP